MIKSKSQLTTDISGRSFSAPEQAILTDMVDSYQDIAPQITTVQRDALTPTLGQIIFNTDVNRYEYFNGTSWFGIGQDLSTPLVVRVDLTNGQLLSLNTSPVTCIPAYGSGYGIVIQSVALKYTYATSAFSSNMTLNLFASTKTNNDYQVRLTDALDSASSTFTITPADSPSDKVVVVDNDSIVVSASTGNPSGGGGAVTLWITYSIIDL